MGVDALQVAQHVEMQRARLQAVGAAVAQAFQMALGGLLLHAAHLDLHFHHLLGELEVAGDEDGLGDAQVVDRQMEELLQLFVAVLGEFQPERSLLGDLRQQSLLDDVADMLEVDRVIDDDDRAAAVFLAQARAAELG